MTRSDERLISVDYVQWLRDNGASADLVAFTDHHAARFSRHEVESAQWRAFLVGLDVAAAVVALVAWLAR